MIDLWYRYPEGLTLTENLAEPILGLKANQSVKTLLLAVTVFSPNGPSNETHADTNALMRLLVVNKTLKILGQPLYRDTVEPFCQALAKNTILKEATFMLDDQNCHLPYYLLEQNSTLEAISVGCNSDPDGLVDCTDLIRGLSGNQTVKKFVLPYKCAACGLVLGEILKVNRTLKELKLTVGSLTDFDGIVEGLKENSS